MLACRVHLTLPHLRKDIATVSMEGVGFPIQSGDVRTALHCTCSRAVVLQTAPLASNTGAETTDDMSLNGSFFICSFMNLTLTSNSLFKGVR